MTRWKRSQIKRKNKKKARRKSNMKNKKAKNNKNKNNKYRSKCAPPKAENTRTRAEIEKNPTDGSVIALLLTPERQQQQAYGRPCARAEGAPLLLQPRMTRHSNWAYSSRSARRAGGRRMLLHAIRAGPRRRRPAACPNLVLRLSAAAK